MTSHLCFSSVISTSFIPMNLFLIFQSFWLQQESCYKLQYPSQPSSLRGSFVLNSDRGSLPTDPKSLLHCLSKVSALREEVKESYGQLFALRKTRFFCVKAFSGQPQGKMARSGNIKNAC
ncbi:UNVERIFIED_CONTAM: hypothetical protein K2H54_030172, partial [Gekko kuhli]